jgi:hypothetical protein
METIDISLGDSIPPAPYSKEGLKGNLGFLSIKGGLSVLQIPKPTTLEYSEKLPIVVNGTFTIKK